MHIKQVIISGFRSFRNQNEIEPFSPKHNVIVGRNGSGKSNFFDVIQFVLLSPKFANLRQEDRQLLLHEGAGSSVMAAYAEIIFDNSDGRFPVESDEVILRRTVGHKKDEYFLNRKRIQKSEVISLLESAGFSKSNPYYIVQQGKVANLCVMKDKDRLELLKEVAGTTVYEDRRTESIKITEDSIKKQEQIDEVLKFIEDRLGELDQEKEELKDYEQLDKNRRCLEYHIYDIELTNASSQLREIESSRDDERENQQEYYTQLRDVQDNLQEQLDNSSTIQNAYDRLMSRKNNLASELTLISEKKSLLAVSIEELEQSIRLQSENETKLINQFNEISTNINNFELQLNNIEPLYQSNLNELSNRINEMTTLKHRLETLYAKQGRGQQFKNVKDRNKFLDQQINSIVTQLKEKNSIIDQINEQINILTNQTNSERNSLSSLNNQIKINIQNFKNINVGIQDKITSRNNLQEKRKLNWKANEQLQEELSQVRHELERSKQQLQSSLPKQISQGLATVDLLAQQLNLTGYYGPLIDNFELKNEVFRTAVEVAAGNALFHVIVDNDKTAATLINELDKRKAGRLTFLPLNQLKRNIQKVTYPDSNDVRPLIDVALNYDEEFEIAIRHVFGMKLLARDLDVAAQFSKEYNLDAITKDGDLVNRKGGFEGGYRDDRDSKILFVLKIRDYSQRLSELELKEQDITKQTNLFEEQINELVREIQKNEAERDHLQSNNDIFSKEVTTRTKQIEINDNNIKQYNSEIIKITSEITLLSDQVSEYEDEKKTPLLSKLTENEREELLTLIDRRNILQHEIDLLEVNNIETTKQREQILSDLKNNFYKSKNEVIEKLLNYGYVIDEGTITLTLSSSSASSTGQNLSASMSIKLTELQSLQNEYNIYNEQINEINNEINEVNIQLDKRKNELNKIEKSIEKLKNNEIVIQEQIIEITKSNDKILNKRTMLNETIQTKQKLIRNLGNVSKKDLDEIKNLSEKESMKNLKIINEKLKKFSSVNRKALDQYISFTEQRDTLVERKEELMKDYESIQELIKTLDIQKEEAILRTFRGVSHHFSEVFKELVPTGEGKLVMRTTDNSDEDDQQESIESKTSFSKFQGVQVLVQFTIPGQQFEMQQLSGGQKAIVALTLIFSIQRCDPAPFYLFDEIDQALDANYRSNVARLISKQSNSTTAPAQFITTTFRPELVAVADKCYGIALQNKVSNIYPLEKEEAQSFVENITNDEAVGQVSSIPNYLKPLASQASVATVRSKSEELPEERSDDEQSEGKEINLFEEEFQEAETALKELSVDVEETKPKKKLSSKRTASGTRKK